MKCPICGSKVSKSGMAGHKGSLNCYVIEQTKRLMAAGWTPLPSGYIRKVKEYGYELKGPLPVRRNAGSHGNSYTTMYWVKQEDYEEIKDEFLDGYTYKWYYKKCKKGAETINFLGVIDKYDTVLFYKKKEPGRTRKRKFIKEGDFLYDLDGYRVGTKIPKEEAPKKLVQEVIASAL